MALHACIIEARKRDPSLDLADANEAIMRAIVALCNLDFDAAAASAEEAEGLLLAAKRR
jgi:hypothetical protein